MGVKIEYLGKTDLLYICQLISTEMTKYVKAVTGKDLSSNDFTDALKTKLEGIDLTKYAAVDSPAFTGLPTAPTASAGTNTTQIATTAFTTKAIADAIKSVGGLSFEKVASYEDLPTIGSSGVIYLVPKTSQTETDKYSEYYWDGDGTTGHYEFLGDTSMDLSNYVTFDDVTEITSTDVKAIWDSVFV